MTQFRAFAKRLNLAITDVEMASSFRWEARQIGSAPYGGFPLASILMSCSKSGERVGSG